MQRYLSLLSSSGITLHSGDSYYAMPHLGSLEIRRELISKASKTASVENSEHSDSDTAELANIIREARTAESDWIAPSYPSNRRTPLEFDRLQDIEGRWSSGEAVNWHAIQSEIEKLGFVVRRREAEKSLTDNPLLGLPIGIELFEVHAQDGSVLAGGRSLNAARAQRGALAEAAERIVGATPSAGSVFVSNHMELRNAGLRLPQIETGARDAFTESLFFDWVPAFTLAGDPAAFPAERAFFNYLPRSGVSAFSFQHTAGLAAGSNLEEAVWAGISECVERDAYWQVMRAQLKTPDLDINRNILKETGLLDAISTARLRLHLKDISLDWPLKIVHALIEDVSNRIPAFSHGVGSHTNMDYAVLKAVEECLQIRSGLLDVCRSRPEDVLFPSVDGKAPSLAWSDPASQSVVSHLMTGEDFAPARGIESSSPTDVVATIEQRVGQIIWAHLGDFEGLKIIRAWVPSAIAPDHSIELNSPRLGNRLRSAGAKYPYLVPILT